MEKNEKKEKRSGEREARRRSDYGKLL